MRILVTTRELSIYIKGYNFENMRKLKVLSLPETIKEKSTFRAKALRRPTNFSFIVSDSERTYALRVL